MSSMNARVRRPFSAALLLAASLMVNGTSAQTGGGQPAAPPAIAAPQPPRQNPANAGSPPASDQTDVKRQPPSDGNPLRLTPAELKRLDQLLSYWESRSGKVKTFSCDFTRYEYDHVFGPQDPRVPKTKCEGIIRYASPDKGEFKVVRAAEFKSPKKGDGGGQFVPQSAEANEHWICDGTSIYELDGEKKQLIQQQLPPELQGKKIAEGPLPFMFGAEKEKLIRRYWMREIKPTNGQKDEYWFEAFPKTREDAANYQKLTVILDSENFLPTALQVFPPNYDARTNPSRTVYTFANRKSDDLIHRSKKFFDRFISPRTPLGWKKVVMEFGAPSPEAQTARQSTDQAQRPATAVPARR